MRIRTEDGKLNVVGERVKARRKALKLKSDGLCARIAAASEGRWAPHEAEIYKIEEQKRSVHDLEVLVLAKALDCTPLWLLLGDSASSGQGTAAPTVAEV